MNAPFSFSRIFSSLGILVLALLSSNCAHPPRETWRMVQSSNLIDVIRQQHFQRIAVDVPPAVMAAHVPQAAPSKAPVLITHIPPSSAPPSSVPPFVQAAPSRGFRSHAENFPVAKWTARPGFVYSPFQANTVIDVQGCRPGQPIRCPGTNRHFRLPGSPQMHPAPMSAGPSVPVPVPATVAPPAAKAWAPSPSAAPAATVPVAAKPKRTTVPAAPVEKKAVASSRPKPQPKPKAKPSAKPKPVASTAKITPPPAIAQAEQAELRTGHRISNQPNLILSPNASFDQQISGEGTKPGEVIFCHHTKEYFRVPPFSVFTESGKPAETVDTSSDTVVPVD